MKKIALYSSRCIALSLLMPHISFALEDTQSLQGVLSSTSTQSTEPLFSSPLDTRATTTHEAQTNAPITAPIEFNYKDEDIINIINTLATKKGVNVIIPFGANALTTKVTLTLPNRITVDQAWSLVLTLLDLSGYSMIPRGDMYYITKKNATIAKEPLPLFVGMKPEELPNTDERIRYIYYLSNIKVSDAADSELATLLKELLPQPDASFKMDPPSNGLIISARSSEIRSLMEVIVKLDKVGFLEKFEIFKLRFTSAKDVAELFNNSILKTDADPNRYRLDTKRTTDATYFSKFTRIIPDSRTNSLIILGRYQAIERIKDFIRTYVDVKIDSGKSPIHVYDLEYLNAKDLADILMKIVTAGAEGGTGQSQVAGALVGGTQRQFGDVKIISDTPPEQGDTNKDESAPRYYGGNKLIIACNSDDWRELEKLIQSLDQPKAQVLIEVLIADMTLEDIRALGMSLRNPDKLPMPGDTNFQTTNLGNEKVITKGESPNATLKADLLQANTPVGADEYVTFAGSAPKGSMVMTFNDANGQVWGVADIMKNIGALKVLSAPHIIATNNKKAIIERGEERLLRDQSSPSGGSTSIAYQFKEAKLSVEITPRISEGDDVNMQIVIKVNEFVKTADNPDPQTPVRRTRELSANATVNNNNILVLGGLAKLGDTESKSETPFLSKIPIIGWLFKGKSAAVGKTNLSIFIKPIVIRPRLRSGLQEHTQEMLSYIDNYTGQSASLFGNLKDPVTKLFFTNKAGSNDLVEDFVRFKKEEYTRTMGAPIQDIDLTEDKQAEEALQKRPEQKPGVKSTKIISLDPQEGKEPSDAQEFITERAERAKELLKDTHNPLTAKQS